MATKRSFWDSPDRRTVIAVALYLGVVGGSIVLSGAGFAGFVGFWLWVAATFTLGWTTRNWLGFLPVPVLSIAAFFAYAFGQSEGEPLPPWFVLGGVAAELTLFMLVGLGSRALYERIRDRRKRRGGYTNDRQVGEGSAGR